MKTAEQQGALPYWAAPLVIFLLAFAVRLAYVFAAGAHAVPDIDSVEYLDYARNLIAGEGYTDGRWRAFRAPGYPFFVAGVFYFFGESVPVLKFFQAVLSALVPVLIYFIGLGVVGPRAALAAGFFSCAYFGLVFEPNHLVSEAVFTPLLTLSVLLLLKTERDWRYSAAAGAALGLTMLARPVGLLFAGAAAVWLFAMYPPRRAARNLLFMALASAAVMAPWWARNYRIFGTFVPVCLETGFVLKHTSTPPEMHTFNDHLPELERDRQNLREGLEYIRSRPAADLLKEGVRDLSGFLYPFMPAYDLTYAFIFPFWLYGVYFVIASRDRRAAILLSMLVYFPVAFAFCGTARHRHSVGPFFILIAAIGAAALLGKAKESASSGRTAAWVFAAWTVLNLIVFLFPEPFRQIVKRLAGS